MSITSHQERCVAQLTKHDENLYAERWRLGIEAGLDCQRLRHVGRHGMVDLAHNSPVLNADAPNQRHNSPDARAYP
jgi:hypothetical protein